MLILTGVTVGTTSSQISDTDSGLDQNETATLWSKTSNECLTDTEYEERYGEVPTAMQELASCTDITFKEPPDTAERWTTHDYKSLEGGNAAVSLYPSHADVANSALIADAHATMFAIQPSTWVHLDADETTHYIAPEGTVRGFVDYRIRLDKNSSVQTHEIDEVRLLRDNDVISTIDGTDTPVFTYSFSRGGSATLTLEADISAQVETDLGNETDVRTDQVTVSQDVPVEVYALQASVYHAVYPNGDQGVAIYQTQPWHGYTLSSDGSANARGVWRYYTGRDTNWDQLTRSSQGRQESIKSDARPVYVYGYPSELGPRIEPIRGGPEILEVWGTESSSPEPTIHENVDVDVVSNSYTRSYGLALRNDEIDRDAITVTGIVRGVNAEIVEPDGGSEREIRESDLSVEVVDANATEATLRIELRDVHSGLPIMLEDPFEGNRFSLIGSDTSRGYISIGDQTVRTNIAGTAEVTVQQPGIYTATYHPASWRSHDPAYVGSTASATWHPLTSTAGWFTLLVDLIRYAIPFTVVLYAAHRIGTFLKIEDTL